jgi:hypothetical protein
LKLSSPLSRTATPRKSEKNSGAATGNSRQSRVQATTAKVSFCERLIFGPRSALMSMPRICFGTSHLIR